MRLQFLSLVPILLVITGCSSTAPTADLFFFEEPIESPVAAHECESEPGQPAELPTWRLLVSKAAWSDLHENVSADVEVDAVACVEREPYPIGLEIQGASTRRLPKKNYKLKFNRGKLLPGSYFGHSRPIDKLIVKAMAKDHSMIREAVAFDLWRELGHDAPHVGFLNLQINRRYHGVYALVEPVDKDYLRRREVSPTGRLYKAVRRMGARASFHPSEPTHLAFDNRTDEEDPTWDDLEILIKKLQKTKLDAAEFWAEIDPSFSLELYIDRMLWVSFTQNSDAIAQNFYLYNLNEDKPNWHLIPWDSDICLGADWRDPNRMVSPSNQPLLDGGNYFSRRLTQVPELRRMYVKRYRQVLAEVFTPKLLRRTFDRYRSLLSRDLELEAERWSYEISAESALGVVEMFLEERPLVIKKGLKEFGEDSEETEDDALEQEEEDD